MIDANEVKVFEGRTSIDPHIYTAHGEELTSCLYVVFRGIPGKMKDLVWGRIAVRGKGIRIRDSRVGRGSPRA